MIGKYGRYMEWVRLLAVFIAVFVADVALTEFREHAVPSASIALGVGLVVIVALHIAEFISVRTIERVAWLRRLILGDQWIEGLWFDEVVDHDLFGLVTISIDGGHVKVSGEQFDSNANVTASWESFITSMEGNTLYTSYRSPQFPGGEPTHVTGFATYIFTGNPGSAAKFYSGSFIDFESHGRRAQLRGSRITDRAVVSRLTNSAARREQVLGLIRVTSSRVVTDQ